MRTLLPSSRPATTPTACIPDRTRMFQRVRCCLTVRIPTACRAAGGLSRPGYLHAKPLIFLPPTMSSLYEDIDTGHPQPSREQDQREGMAHAHRSGGCLHRPVALMGLGRYGLHLHITAKIPGPEHHFSHQSLRHDVRRDHRIASAGESRSCGNGDGLAPHQSGRFHHPQRAVHAARARTPGACCTPTASTAGVSARRRMACRPSSQQSIFVLSLPGYHDYEGEAARR